MSVTLAMARRTPLPPYLVASPSRSSSASCAPVEAPDGTDALDRIPPFNSTKTLKVGLPRESSISIAPSDTIFVFVRRFVELRMLTPRSMAQVICPNGKATPGRSTAEAPMRSGTYIVGSASANWRRCPNVDRDA